MNTASRFHLTAHSVTGRFFSDTTSRHNYWSRGNNPDPNPDRDLLNPKSIGFNRLSTRGLLLCQVSRYSNQGFLCIIVLTYTPTHINDKVITASIISNGIETNTYNDCNKQQAASKGSTLDIAPLLWKTTSEALRYGSYSVTCKLSPYLPLPRKQWHRLSLT